MRDRGAFTSQAVMMFLTEAALSAKIREVLGGRDVACAVAFWGRGSAGLLSSAKGRRPRVVCNVTLGGTNPEALTELRKNLGGDLRHHPNLHAKVYLSDRGLVVGSANASDNGVGLTNGGMARFLEAGSFHGAGTSAWHEATAWFHEAFERASAVDDAAIAMAGRTWSTPRAPTRTEPVGADGSLLDLVCARPDAFHDIGLVFVDQLNDRATLADINDEEQDGDEDDAAAPRWEFRHSFLNWHPEQVASWPARFVWYWLRGQPRVQFRRVIAKRLDDRLGHVLTRPCTTEVRRWLTERGVVIPPKLTDIAQADGTFARRFCANGGRVYRNGFELVEEVEALRA